MKTTILPIALLYISNYQLAECSEYRNWTLANEISDSTSNDDSDDDGNSNLLEYACGTDPRKSSAIGRIEQGVVVYSKGESARSSGSIQWQIQTNDSLDPETWQAIGDTIETDSSIQLSLFSKGIKKRFVRLAVSRTIHPAALDYANRTGLTGTPLEEVSGYLHDLSDAGVEPDFLILAGSRYRSILGNVAHAVIGGTGTIGGNVTQTERSIRLAGTGWIDFDNPAKDPDLSSYTLHAVASSDSTTSRSVIASSYGGAEARGPQMMFNASTSWGSAAGRLWADVNTGSSSATSGWNTTTKVHSGSEMLPCTMTYGTFSMP